MSDGDGDKWRSAASGHRVEQQRTMKHDRHRLAEAQELRGDQTKGVRGGMMEVREKERRGEINSDGTYFIEIQHG